jgi:hypothetical protein
MGSERAAGRIGPRGEPRRLRVPSRRTVALAAAIACALAAAAAAGWWSAGSAGRDLPAATPGERTATVGPVSVAVTGEWEPVTRGAPRLDGLRAATFAPVPGLPVHAIVAFGPSTDPSLIPAALTSPDPTASSRARAAPRPALATLAGLAAWNYDDLSGWRRGDVAELTVVPTTAGVLSVICVGPRSLWSVVHGCAGGVQRVELRGAVALPPSPGLAMRRRLPDAVADLNADRRAGRAALARAGTRRGQARAAARLAAAHRAAGRSLRPWAAGAEARGVVEAIGPVAGAYGRLANAARQGRPQAYRAARRSVAASERRLGEALRRASSA